MVTTYLIDSSFIIDYFRKKEVVYRFVDEHENDILITSALCEAELSEGIYREKPENVNKKLQEKNSFLSQLSEIISFDRQQADIAGRIRAELSKKGALIGDVDILIAAAAMARNAILVTKNLKHFQKISGLQAVNI